MLFTDYNQPFFRKCQNKFHEMCLSLIKEKVKYTEYVYELYFFVYITFVCLSYCILFMKHMKQILNSYSEYFCRCSIQ